MLKASLGLNCSVPNIVALFRDFFKVLYIMQCLNWFLMSIIYINLIGFHFETAWTQTSKALSCAPIPWVLCTHTRRRSRQILSAYATNCKSLKPCRGLNDIPAVKADLWCGKGLWTRTPLNTIMNGWMAEARVVHSLEDRNKAWVDGFPSHVTVCTSCCWSLKNLKKQPRNMLLGLLVESKLSAVNCETHLPRCSITVYAVCVLNG